MDHLHRVAVQEAIHSRYAWLRLICGEHRDTP
jgi:hypothetical protein